MGGSWRVNPVVECGGGGRSGKWGLLGVRRWCGGRGLSGGSSGDGEREAVDGGYEGGAESGASSSSSAGAKKRRKPPLGLPPRE